MKTKHFLFTAALLSAFSACTNEDIVSEGNTMKDDKGILVEVGPNFTIAASKVNDAVTRAYDKDGKFVWLPQEINTTSGAADLPATLGLCWTGVNNVNAEGSALAATDHRVFTNYKFEHKGWLYEGESVPDYDICGDNEIKNGEFLPGEGGTPEAAWNNPTYKASVSGKTLDLGIGFFKSNLGTIYQGEYIVYFPYSDSFFNSPIVATAPKMVELENLPVEVKVNDKVSHNADSYAAMSKYGFNVGYSYNMDGGVETQSFTTKSLSGGVVVRLTNSANKLGSKITTVTLYSKNKQFILKQELSAAAIKAAGNNGEKYGKDFYYGEPVETSKTVVAKVGALEPKDKKYVDIVIPVLPTSIDDLTVLLTNENNKTAEVKVEGVTEVKSVGQGWTLLEDIDLKGLEFNKVYAMDEESFMAATGNTETQPCNTDLKKDESLIVRVLGHIEIDKDMPIAIRGGYTIEGEEGDALILKSGNKVNLDGTDYDQNRRFIVNMANADLTKYNEPVLDCDVIVEDAGCCNKFGSRLVIGQATIGKNAHITVMGHKEGVTPKESTKDGWLSFDVEGMTSTINGTIVNNGQITFGRTDRKPTLVKAQSLLNGSITNNKGMTIFYAGAQTTSDDDAKLAVSSTGILNNETGAEFTIEGELFFDGTGHNNGTIYDRVSSQVTGKLSQYRGGEYVCDVNDPGKRFGDALTSVYKPTTVVRFVEEASKIYDFTKFANVKNDIKKYIVAVGNATTYFKGENITLPAVEVEKENTLGFVSAKDGSKIIWTNLTVKGDLVVDGTIETVGADGLGNQISGTNNYYYGINNLTVNNNFTVNGKAVLNNKVVNVAKTWYIGYTPNNTKSIVKSTTVYVGSKSANGGLFDIQGLVDLQNNTDILVYGDVNAGKKAVATILEATGSDTAMPATVTYTGKNTYSNILTNWPKGGPSKMIE